MVFRKRESPIYKIIGAYDSETTNYVLDGVNVAFPILHQLGILNTDIENVSADNVEQACSVHLYRHSLDLYETLDDIAASKHDFVPVICCHNLSFDMYGLSQWLARHDVKVLAKSATKPITFAILNDEGKPCLVIWDTLIFTQTSLARMGEDCGYHKAVGEWDYNLIRTPETELTPEEIDYSKRDIYTLLAYLGWWLKRNPDIEPSKLALNVVTKTGVVRERRKVRFSKLKNGRKSIGDYWIMQNIAEAPQTDDELFTMQACTRGGFTFCSAKAASIPYDLRGTGKRVYAFDATSQHPAQMVSHKVPEKFHRATPANLTSAFELIQLYSLEHVLANWVKPFGVAFNACFEFENLRPKAGSLFERFGIVPLASARYKPVEFVDEDNGDSNAHIENRFASGYVDQVENPKCAFGKLVSASKARIWLTELAAWEVCQCYDFDSVRGITGYLTGRFVKPTDMSTVSVMQFYKAKNEFKKARGEFYSGKPITNADELRTLGISDYIVSGMENRTVSDTDIEAQYLSLKADLNALFGIEASNEYRRDTVLDESNGIQYVGSFGLCNKPRTPKAWYQYGQRIVGWSRIAQICVLELLEPYIDMVVNGDTDSVKAIANTESLPAIMNALQRLSNAIDKGKERICERVKELFPNYYDSLDGIGHYVYEFESECFCASWNKAYCRYDIDKRTDERRYDFTIAGLPTARVNALANDLMQRGYTFEQVCNVMLGYNVTYAYDAIRLNGRKFPEWASTFFETVTDYEGNSCRVCEPCALALYPMAKTINDTANYENKENLSIAKANNPNVNDSDLLITSNDIFEYGELF